MVPLNGSTGVVVAMDYQVLFNIALTLVAALGGWVLNSITSNLRTLSGDLKILDLAHQRTREEYVPKAEHKDDIAGVREALGNLDKKIDHVGERLEGKLDRLIERMPHPPLTP